MLWHMPRELFRKQTPKISLDTNSSATGDAAYTALCMRGAGRNWGFWDNIFQTCALLGTRSSQGQNNLLAKATLSFAHCNDGHWSGKPWKPQCLPLWACLISPQDFECWPCFFLLPLHLIESLIPSESGTPSCQDPVFVVRIPLGPTGSNMKWLTSVCRDTDVGVLNREWTLMVWKCFHESGHWVNLWQRDHCL